jgi:hypothetical protein
VQGARTTCRKLQCACASFRGIRANNKSVRIQIPKREISAQQEPGRLGNRFNLIGGCEYRGRLQKQVTQGHTHYVKMWPWVTCLNLDVTPSVSQHNTLRYSALVTAAAEDRSSHLELWIDRQIDLSIYLNFGALARTCSGLSRLRAVAALMGVNSAACRCVALRL